MATLFGPEAGHAPLAPTAAVQIDSVSVVKVFKLIKVTSFVPVFATTAIPVAGLIATSLGDAALFGTAGSIALLMIEVPPL